MAQQRRRTIRLAVAIPADADNNRIKWTHGTDKLTPSRLFAYLQQNAKAYIAVEKFPHHKPLADHFYIHRNPEGGDGTKSWRTYSASFARRPKPTAN